jgi:Secretion system C-terminal sorting domain
MKKIIVTLLLLSLPVFALAQCNEPFAVPYTATSENATIPGLPDCMDSTYLTFDSDEVFTTIAGPVAGFTGKLLAYNTVTASQGGGGVQPMVGTNLYTHEIQMEQGVGYTIAYKYKNSDAAKTINSFGLRIELPANGFYLDLVNQLSVTGATVTNFVSQPFNVPATGGYTFNFSVQSAGNQGFLYLDDITVQEVAEMAVDENALSAVVAWPNPTMGRLTISSGAYQPERVEVYSLTGKLLCSENISTLTHEVNMDTYAAGLYLLHIYQGSQVKKIKIYKY